VDEGEQLDASAPGLMDDSSMDFSLSAKKKKKKKVIVDVDDDKLGLCCSALNSIWYRIACCFFTGSI